MPKPSITTDTLIQMARNAVDDCLNKEAFRRAGQAFMRKVVKLAELQKGEYNIRFNPGGQAVSGDLVLHTDTVYIHLNDMGLYWRSCKGQKDYTGGPNLWPTGPKNVVDLAWLVKKK